MGNKFLTEEAATIETNIGPVRLALRFYQRNKNARFIKKVWLGFDEKDEVRSRPVLQQSRDLDFELWTDESIDGNFCIYLGRDLSRWDREFVISLKLEDTDTSGARTWNRWRAKPKDVKRIKNKYWCAAKAYVTVCSDIKKPVLRENGQALQTIVELGYEGDYSKLYEDVLADLSRLNLQGHLAAQFEQYLDYQKKQHKWAEDSQAYELYRRLKGMLPRYETALRQIIMAPATQLVPTLHHYTLSPTQAGVLLHERSGTMEACHVLEGIEVKGKSVPTNFTAVQPVRTERMAANQFVAQSVHRIQTLLDFVARHLRREIEREKVHSESRIRHKCHQDALNELLQDQLRFKRYRQQLPQPIAGADVTAASTSAVLYYDYRYTTLRRLTDLVDRVLSYVDTEAIPNAIESFSRLYEHWCFIQVVEALLKLGFEFANPEGRKKTDFYWHPIQGEVNCELIHPALRDVILEVWYEREYPKLERETDEYPKDRPYGLEKRGYKRNSWFRKDDDDEDKPAKNKPDIALEFHDRVKGGPPKIVTIDPTLGAPHNHEEKYYYQYTIRSFVDLDPNSGESLRIVKAAWGISPWKSRKADILTTDTYMLESENSFDRGFIYLKPDATLLAALPETLGAILNYAGILPIKEKNSP